MGRNNTLRLNPKFLYDCFLKTMLNVFGSKFVLQTPNKFGLNIAQQDSDYEVCGQMFILRKTKTRRSRAQWRADSSSFSIALQNTKKGFSVLECEF